MPTVVSQWLVLHHNLILIPWAQVKPGSADPERWWKKLGDLVVNSYFLLLWFLGICCCSMFFPHGDYYWKYWLMVMNDGLWCGFDCCEKPQLLGGGVIFPCSSMGWEPQLTNVLGESTGTVNIDDPWHYYPFRIAILEYIIHKYTHLIRLYLNISYVSLCIYFTLYIYIYTCILGISVSEITLCYTLNQVLLHIIPSILYSCITYIIYNTYMTIYIWYIKLHIYIYNCYIIYKYI